MSTEASRKNPKIGSVILQLQEKVKQRYPEARFEVFEGEDPKGTYLRAIVDVEDSDEVVDVVIDRLLPLQVEEELPLYFVVSRPIDRVVAQMQAQIEYKSRPKISDILPPLQS